MLSLAISFQIAAGPFAPAPRPSDPLQVQTCPFPPLPRHELIDNGSTAIDAKSPSIVAWAQDYENYFTCKSPNIEANPACPEYNEQACSETDSLDENLTCVNPQWQTPGRALNSAGNSYEDGDRDYTNDVVSLGRGGSITLLFDPPIRNGEGYDLAVFENSFSDSFLELAWVEVSSNGVDFFRFYNISLTQSAVNSYGNIDPTDVTGLAGKYCRGYGTPFDLEQLTITHSNLNNLDLNRISHVKIIDILGDGSHYDSITSGNGPNPIYDPYPTSGSAGFDLDAVAALYVAEALYEENVPIPPLFLSLLSLLILFTYQLSRSFQSPKKYKPLEL